LIEGDIAVVPVNSSDGFYERKIWDRGVVPYYFDHSMSRSDRSRIRKVTRYLMDISCLDFQEITAPSNTRNSITFTKRGDEWHSTAEDRKGCWSYYGMQQWTKSQVRIYHINNISIFLDIHIFNIH